jgi:hypothetical protein
LIFVGSPPSAAIASRIAARSTTQGTPVKSCSSTRAVRNAISLSTGASRPTWPALSMSALHEAAVLATEQVLEQNA